MLLLPALPPSWTCGSVEGLCAKGGLTVSLCWAAGQLTSAAITASAPYEGTVRCGEHAAPLRLDAGQTLTLSPALTH